MVLTGGMLRMKDIFALLRNTDGQTRDGYGICRDCSFLRAFRCVQAWLWRGGGRICAHHVVVHAGAAQGHGFERLQGASGRHDGVGAGNRRDDVFSDPLGKLVRHPLRRTPLISVAGLFVYEASSDLTMRPTIMEP